MRTVTATAVWLSLSFAALAGPLEEADSAHRAGDFTTAADRYRPLAAQGEPVAQFRLGVLYEEGKGITKDSREAIRWYVVASAQGHAEAAYNLARMYHDGRGVPQDHRRARHWYKVAAQQGDTKALVNLGVMTVHGDGGPRHYRKALELFSVAAHRGDGRAKDNIGTMFLKGLGVSRDLLRAYMWFDLAAAHGDLESIRNRDKVGRMMTHKDILRAKQMATELQRHFQQRGQSSRCHESRSGAGHH